MILSVAKPGMTHGSLPANSNATFACLSLHLPLVQPTSFQHDSLVIISAWTHQAPFNSIQLYLSLKGNLLCSPDLPFLFYTVSFLYTLKYKVPGE